MILISLFGIRSIPGALLLFILEIMLFSSSLFVLANCLSIFSFFITYLLSAGLTNWFAIMSRFSSIVFDLLVLKIGMWSPYLILLLFQIFQNSS